MPNMTEKEERLRMNLDRAQCFSSLAARARFERISNPQPASPTITSFVAPMIYLWQDLTCQQREHNTEWQYERCCKWAHPGQINASCWYQNGDGSWDRCYVRFYEIDAQHGEPEYLSAELPKDVAIGAMRSFVAS